MLLPKYTVSKSESPKVKSNSMLWCQLLCNLPCLNRMK